MKTISDLYKECKMSEDFIRFLKSNDISEEKRNKNIILK
jgi:hypothetical protein